MSGGEGHTGRLQQTAHFGVPFLTRSAGQDLVHEFQRELVTGSLAAPQNRHQPGGVIFGTTPLRADDDDLVRGNSAFGQQPNHGAAGDTRHAAGCRSSIVLPSIGRHHSNSVVTGKRMGIRLLL